MNTEVEPRVDVAPRPEPASLHGLHPHRMTDLLGGPGRARQVFRALGAGLDPVGEGVLPDGLRARLESVVRPGPLRLAHTQVSADGTTKLLVASDDGGAVEVVVIPEARRASRATLCVSSQLGCARGCRFCVTATMGLRRNLSVAEIVQQVHLGLRVSRERGWALRNLVFMGMGEPLDNASAVAGALRILTDHRGYGFAPKHVTVSTVAPRLNAVARLKGWPARIAWSLHAAEDDVRVKLVPPPHPSVAATAAAFAEVCAADRRPLFVEMTLMDGVNDRDADMDAAAGLFAGFPTEARFNLIAMNPGRADLRPSRRVEACRDRLVSAGFFCSIRQPRGQDAAAACGQLAVTAPRDGGPPSPRGTLIRLGRADLA